MEKSLKDKRILVTGAGGGIGHNIVVRLHALGASVIAVARSEEQLNALQQEAPGLETICVDLSNWEATRNALEAIETPLDGVVNNAGCAILTPFLEATESEIDKVFAVNVKAAMNVSQVIARGMVKAGKKGSIVNVSSQASIAALKDHAVYCSSKAALDGLSRVMALELGPHGIRVNCVNPTVIMTPMGRLGWGDPEVAGPMLAKIPLKRFGEVDEVVDVILYLLSDMSSLITGVALPVDGGFTAC